MVTDCLPLRTLLLIVTGLANREQQRTIEYHPMVMSKFPSSIDAFIFKVALFIVLGAIAFGVFGSACPMAM